MTLVLLHSPLVGPLTWRAVAALLPDAVAPDLSGAVTHASVASLVAAQLDGDDPVVLAGHSGAGPLLPRIARAVRQPVDALIYVDSVLPHPGESWIENAPAGLVDRLRGIARDGVLPPWNEWFDPAAVASLLPDDEMRGRFVAELPRLPFSYFEEKASADVWNGPASYLLLSEGYRDDAAAARKAGLPVAEHVDHHLSMLTDPAAVAAALRRLCGGSAP
ncbi:alpha/beta fold hydrolase [Actinoplanes sp. NPDC051633]|uniref:alpha/beta fold hydrolase n=1 Tax=Actinoplanes sp. NPDC051633 TaxID=3155670 RepID=UPI00342BD85C